MALFKKKNKRPNSRGSRLTGHSPAAYEEYKRTVRKNISLFSAIFVALFTAMTISFAHAALAEKESRFNNDYNRRDELMEKHTLRGTIYAGDGETVLAYSEAYTDEEGDIRQRRIYPFSEAFAHAVGYAALGGSGVEAFARYDLLTSDLPLSRKVEFDDQDDPEERLYPGNELTVTLDPVLQLAAYQAMEGYEGALIVTEVSTGRILAMVSKPDYDPERIEEMWEEIIQDDESGLLLNRVTQGQYPPGSTFKIIDCIELLQEDPLALENYRYECSGVFTDGEDSIHCYANQSHGKIGLRESFAFSCNSSFANIGLNYLDRKAFQKTLQNLYFNRELPYDLPSTVSSADDVKSMDDVQMMQLSIGQGTTGMSPLHMHMITSAIAAGGVLYKPQLLKELRNADGKLLKSYREEICGPLMTQDIANTMKQLMRLVVQAGTASQLSGRSYDPCGKTGSAEFDDNKSSHAWFTGFAPATDPEICITVLIEGKGMASSYAVPVAGEVMDVYFGE